MYKEIDGFNNYCVTSGGVIFNKETGKELKPMKRKTGYMEVCLFDTEHKRHYITVHRIVAKAFCDNPDNKTEVNHIDGNKNNNHSSNLEWVTRNENLKHAYDIGLKQNDTSAKAVIATCIETGLARRFKSIYEAAKTLKISNGNICMCCKGQRPYAGGYKWRYA